MVMEIEFPGLSQCVLIATVYDDSKDNSASMFTLKQADYITPGKLVKV